MSSKKTTQLIAVIIIVIVLIAGGYLIFHKKKTNTNTPTSQSTTTTSGSSSSKSGASTAAGPLVQTKSASNVGSYLADANGNALYTYGGDSQGVSNCTGSCLYSWPIYEASSTSASLPANVTVITRSDGTKQYAYKGLPLYTFTGDSVGQVTGDNVSNFHVAKP